MPSNNSQNVFIERRINDSHLFEMTKRIAYTTQIYQAICSMIATTKMQRYLQYIFNVTLYLNLASAIPTSMILAV